MLVREPNTQSQNGVDNFGVTRPDTGQESLSMKERERLRLAVCEI